MPYFLVTDDRNRNKSKKQRINLFDCRGCVHEFGSEYCSWSPNWGFRACDNCWLGYKNNRCRCEQRATREEKKAGRCKYYAERCDYKGEEEMNKWELEVKCEVLRRDVENLTRTLEEGREELEDLRVENAELKARLEKAGLDKTVELPCKPGDKVFAIVGSTPAVEEFVVTSIEIFKSITYVRVDGYFKISFPLSEYGGRFFTDLEAAEARLKGLLEGGRKSE